MTDPRPDLPDDAGPLVPESAELTLMRVSHAVAVRDRDALRAACAEAVARGAVVPVDEVLLQAGLFLGYPAALDAFREWAGVRPETPRRSEVPAPSDWKIRGEALCRRVYGSAFDALRATVRQLHPDLEYGMIADGYGRILSRPGLDSRNRELNAIVVLAADERDLQLHSHLRGALHVGASPADVESALAIGCRDLPDDARNRLYATWRAVRERAGGSRACS